MRNCIAMLAVVIGRSKACSNLISCAWVRPNLPVMSANGWLRKHDRSRPHSAHSAGKLNVFDCFGEALQAAAILFEKAQTRPIDLAVDQKPDQPFVSQAGSKGQLALGDVESSLRVTKARS